MPPADHAALLARQDYPVPPGGDFTPAERDLLTKFGAWLDALSAGRIAPVTPDQVRFVAVSRGSRAPETAHELAWVKLLRLRAEVRGRFSELTRAREEAARVEAEYESRRAAVLATVREQLAAVSEDYAERMQEAADAARAAEQAVRDLVLRLGQSLHVGGVQVNYAAGRVTWDDERLSEYAESHPELKEFRRVGKPWVAVRYTGPTAVAPPPRQLPPAEAPGAGE